VPDAVFEVVVLMIEKSRSFSFSSSEAGSSSDLKIRAVGVQV
jgi:hypothetical protein